MQVKVQVQMCCIECGVANTIEIQVRIHKQMRIQIQMQIQMKIQMLVLVHRMQTPC